MNSNIISIDEETLVFDEMLRLLFPQDTNIKCYTEVSTQQIKPSKGQNHHLQPPSILPQPPSTQPQPPLAKQLFSIPSEVQFQQLNPTAGQFPASSASNFSSTQLKFSQQMASQQSQQIPTHSQMPIYPQFVKQNYQQNAQHSIQPNQSQYASQSQNPWEISSKQEQYQVQQPKYSQQFAQNHYQDQQKQQSNPSTQPTFTNQQFHNYYQYPQPQMQSQRPQQLQGQSQQQPQNPSNLINSSNKYQHYPQQTMNNIPISYSQGIPKQFSYSSALSMQTSNGKHQLDQDQQIQKNIPQSYSIRSPPIPSLSSENNHLQNPISPNHTISNNNQPSSNFHIHQSLPIPYPDSHQDHKIIRNANNYDQNDIKDQKKTISNLYFLDDQNYKSQQSESTAVQVTRFTSHLEDNSSDSSLIILESQALTPPHTRQKKDSIDSKKNSKQSSLIKSIKKKQTSSNKKEQLNSKEKEKKQIPLLILEDNSIKQKPQLKPIQKKKKKISSDKKIISIEEEEAEDNEQKYQQQQQQQELIVIKIKKSIPKLQLKSKNVFGSFNNDSAEDSGAAEDHTKISGQQQQPQLHHHSQHQQQKLLLSKQLIPRISLQNIQHSILPKSTGNLDYHSIQQGSEPCRQIQSENKKESQTQEQQFKFKIEMSAFLSSKASSDKTIPTLSRLQDSKMFFYNILGQERKGFAQQINLENKILKLQEEKENITKFNPIGSTSTDNNGQEGKDYHNNIMNSAVETIVIAAEEDFEVDESEEKSSQVNRYFSENKGQVCFRCGKSGHFRSACLSGQRDREYNCHYCLGGHYSGRCEQKVCFRCGIIGHERNQCPLDVSRFARCNKCTRVGHQIEKCGVLQPSNNHPLGEKLSFSSTGQEEDGRYQLCLNCKKYGHINCSASPMLTDNVYENKVPEEHAILLKEQQLHLADHNLKKDIIFERQKSPPKLEVSQIFARRQQQLILGSNLV